MHRSRRVVLPRARPRAALRAALLAAPLAACQWLVGIEGTTTGSPTVPDGPISLLDGGHPPLDGDPPGPFDGPRADAPGPPPVPVRIAAGGLHTCVLLSDGAVRCWGDNGQGQVAPQTLAVARIPQPTPVQLGLAAVDLALGAAHSCAVLEDGRVLCWGSNAEHQLGSADGGARGPLEPGTDTDPPTPLAGARRVHLGRAHSCALGPDQLWCWGAGERGQLDRSEFASSASPVYSGTGTGAFALGADHVLWELGGGLRAWGAGTNGQLGPNSPSADSSVAAIVPVSEVSSVAAGRAHSCVRSGSEGGVSCWGANASAQLGTEMISVGGPDPSQIPAASFGSLPIRALAAGGDNACVLTDDGGVYCWGANADGQLGQDPEIDRQTMRPLRVLGLPEPALLPVDAETACPTLAVGGGHVCAITVGDRVYCWGRNVEGQAGHPAELASVEPTLVPL